MKKNIVEISYTGNNFSASVPSLPGCVSVGNTPREVEENIQEAIDFHLEGMEEGGASIPSGFKKNYELIFRFDTQTLLLYYKGIFKATAIEALTGINQKQILQYSSGTKKPRLAQRKKIEEALHQLGSSLLSIQL